MPDTNTNPPPVYALSIRQPWAWLIVNGYKDLENRSWYRNFKGRIYVHASKGMTMQEYDDACSLALSIDSTIPIPAYEDIERGGIVGAVDITGCVRESSSPWYMGECGFTLENPEPLEFIPYKGALGFFKVEL